MTDFAVRQADWTRDRDALRNVRTRVFVEEQNVPLNLEWDELDSQCVHMIATHNNAAIGTGRLTPDGHIGRMAVLAYWRGHGVGRALLEALMTAARERGDNACRLNAQVSAIGFYERFGFNTEGAEFMEAGIPHQTMVLQLDSAPVQPSIKRSRSCPSPLLPSGGKGELEGDSDHRTEESPSRSPFPASQAKGREGR